MIGDRRVGRVRGAPTRCSRSVAALGGVLALAGVAGLGGFGVWGVLGGTAAASAGPPVVPHPPPGRPAVHPPCDEVLGATWTPVPVTCPTPIDGEAVARCSAEGIEALVGGVGYPTVQQAIDAAPPQGVIVLCPGAYTEVWVLGDKQLLAADPTEGATVLDSGGGTRTERVEVDGGALRGITFTQYRGVNVAGGGTFECLTSRHLGGPVVHQPSSTTPGSMVVRHSVFSKSFYPAIQVQGNDLLIEDSAFTEINNVNGSNGGAVYAGPNSNLTVRRTEFRDNIQDSGAEDHGAAIHSRGPSLTIEDSWFEGNHSKDEFTGGVVFVHYGDTVVRGSTFVGNRSDSLGAGLVSRANVYVADSTFVDNVSCTEFATCDTTGVLSADELTVERTRIERNSILYQFLAEGSAVTQFGYGFHGTDLVVRENTGGEAALYLADGATAECACCDFGNGTLLDNAPLDAAVAGGARYLDLPLDFAL